MSSLSFTEEDVRRAAQTKSWIEDRLNELKEEEGRLRELLSVVDSVLKAASFTRASELGPRPVTTQAFEPAEETRLLKSREGRILAQAHITPKSVSIILGPDIKLAASTPPFQTFYMKRILGGMRHRDEEMMQTGNLKPDEIINFVVEEDAGRLKKIVINNYRDKERLNDILKSATWVFTRMLEKT